MQYVTDSFPAAHQQRPAALAERALAHHATIQRVQAERPRLSRAALARIEAYLEAHAAQAVTLENLQPER